MPTVSQPSANPTRKLTAAMIGMSIATAAKAYITNKYPYFGDPAIWEPLPIIIGFAAGYVVKDKPNV